MDQASEEEVMEYFKDYHIKETNIHECMNILELLKEKQFRVEIIGESWYDGDSWEIIIHDPANTMIVSVESRYPETIIDCIKSAINNLIYETNSFSVLYHYYIKYIYYNKKYGFNL